MYSDIAYLCVCSRVRCICGLLRNKCRVLVTHQLQHLRTADQILVLREVCGTSNLKDGCLLVLSSVIFERKKKQFPASGP